MNLCPCLKNIIDKITNKKVNKSYTPKQFEQESFISPIHEQHSLIDTLHPPFNKNIKNNKPAPVIPSYTEQEESKSLKNQEDLMNYKIQLEDKPILLSTPETPERDIQDLIKDQLGITPLEVIKNVEVKPQSKEQLLQEISQDTNQHVFSINLDPLDPYYGLIHEKISKVTDLLAKKGPYIQISAPNKTNLSIMEVENTKVSTFLLKYEIHCQYSYYLSLMKNDRLHSTLNNLIAEVKVVESFRPNLTRNTMRFKRMGSFQARDCNYIKYHNGSKRQHWQIYLHDEKSQSSPDYKLCEIFCVKNIRVSSQTELLITEYIEVDLQLMNPANIIPKLANEYKNYLNNLQTHIQKNYETELV